MSTIYILSDNNKKIWGVYNSDIHLENMINTIKSINNNITLEIEEKILNTNISKKYIKNPEFKNNKLCIENETLLNKNKLYNKEIENEVRKIEELYETFKKDYDSYKKIIENNLEIPHFFEEKYNIFENIENNNIEKKDQFNYFLSNIYLR